MKAFGMLHGTPMRRFFDNDARGYHAIYRPNEANRCPGCGRSHWIVGRTTVECAFCSTALPIAVPAGGGQ